MTDEELVKRLREGATWDDDVAAADRIEALTEQLEAARADAKEAEAYAEELGKEIELNEQEACMLENDFIKADKQIDALKAKLAKAVDGLQAVAQHEVSIFLGLDAEKNERASWRGVMRKVKATLAEIEGEKE